MYQWIHLVLADKLAYDGCRLILVRPCSYEKGLTVSEHAVIIRFEYGATGLDPLHELEDTLTEVIESQGVGEYDGHDIAVDGSDGTLYMYGPDADRLFSAVKERLLATPVLKNAIATLRYGPPEDGVPEVEVNLDA